MSHPSPTLFAHPSADEYSNQMHVLVRNITHDIGQHRQDKMLIQYTQFTGLNQGLLSYDSWPFRVRCPYPADTQLNTVTDKGTSPTTTDPQTPPPNTHTHTHNDQHHLILNVPLHINPSISSSIHHQGPHTPKSSTTANPRSPIPPPDTNMNINTKRQRK